MIEINASKLALLIVGLEKVDAIFVIVVMNNGWLQLEYKYMITLCNKINKIFLLVVGVGPWSIGSRRMYKLWEKDEPKAGGLSLNW